MREACATPLRNELGTRYGPLYSSTIMAKLKWRCWDAPLRATLVVFSLVVVLSTATFSMVPANSWGYGSFGSTFKSAPTPAPAFPTAVFVEDAELQYPGALAPASKYTAGADYSVIAAGDTSFAPSYEVEEVPVPSPTPEPALAPKDEEERFLSPLLYHGVGAGNQLMEYLTAAVIARAINRTLCLPPFFSGPSKHSTGHTARVLGGMSWADRYDVDLLSRFTRVASLETCLQRCNYTVDAIWSLKGAPEPLVRGWRTYPSSNESWNMDWSCAEWQSPRDIYTSLGSYTDRCVGLTGLFPGLRWRGSFLAISAFLQPSSNMMKIADILENNAIGQGTPYLAVHWRFEESQCKEFPIGLCFVRCSDGAIVDSGLHPLAKEWLKAEDTGFCGNKRSIGVGLHKMDLIAAIEERAKNHSFNTVYLATDGWMRGADGVTLLTELTRQMRYCWEVFLEDALLPILQKDGLFDRHGRRIIKITVILTLRSRGLRVVGLWKIPDVPNFDNGMYFDQILTFGKDNKVNGQHIQVIEQEICVRSAVFLGSGQSTWSLAIFRIRLARRRTKQLLADLVTGHESMDQKAQDEFVIQDLFKDNHVAGLVCYYSELRKRKTKNETVETYAEEYPDGWLDLEACEGRINYGGRCQLAKCF